MKNVLDTIRKYMLIRPGDRVAVACSGGKDSMSLLHFLVSNKDQLKAEITAVNVDHGIRDNSSKDSEFVAKYCKENGIKLYSFMFNAKEYSYEHGLTLEEGARILRYNAFKKLVNDGVVDKVALAHHKLDQVETILLNIFRGTGLNGASGMGYIRDRVFIRPMLNVDKDDIMAYINDNNIPYVEDETNSNTNYSRNYIRNVLLPSIREKWPSIDDRIINFGNICRQDDEFIESLIDPDAVNLEKNICKISVKYLSNNNSLNYRIILRALKLLGVAKDIDGKHLELICLLRYKDNGARINLPNNIIATKEYDYIVLSRNGDIINDVSIQFNVGKIDFENFGVIEAVRTENMDLFKYNHLVDADKIPSNAVWRYRHDGDKIEKFGGGTKLLSDYLNDKKIPLRMRDTIPLLADDNEILIIAGVEISNKIKIDENTRHAYGINIIK